LARERPGWDAECIMSLARAGIVALALVVVLALAAAAAFGVSLSAVSRQPAQPSPAEVVASRFPPADTTLPDQPVMTFSTANVMPVEHWETFDQGALLGIATGDPRWPFAAATPAVETPAAGAQAPTAAQVPLALATTEPPAAQSNGEAAAVVEAGNPAAAKTQAANAPARRPTGRSNSVLNDAQIASLKRRLNLTAEQERMWPAVEAALRKIVYTQTAMNPHARGAQSGGSTPYIDPTSAEVRQLKAVAVPLMQRLNDEQKREVKMLAYVMGLESVASQF
jgi:hypothetical protein